METKHPLIGEILADAFVSISTLKVNPAAVIAEAQLRQVAILNRNKPVAYVISPLVWEYLCELHADMRDTEEALAALEEEGESISIDLDDLLD